MDTLAEWRLVKTDDARTQTEDSMQTLSRLWQIILGWCRPAPPIGRVRVTCPTCGKRVAVIASTGQLWRHRCQPRV